MDRPDINDNVVAFQGPHRGTAGVLRSFEGEDAVIEMEDKMFKSLPFKELVKIDHAIYPGHIVGTMLTEDANRGFESPTSPKVWSPTLSLVRNQVVSFSHPTPTPTKSTLPSKGLLTSGDVSSETKKRGLPSIYNRP